MSEKKYIEEDEIDLRELALTIIKNKKILLITTIVFLILGIAYTGIRVAPYEVKYYVMNGIGGYDDGDPLPGLKISELKEWLEARLYRNSSSLEKFENNYSLKAENPGNTNLIEFSTQASDTKEVNLYIQNVLQIINESPVFLERLEFNRVVLEEQIKKVKNRINNLNIQIYDIDNRVNLINNNIKFMQDSRQVNKDEIKENKDLIKYYNDILEENKLMREKLQEMKVKTAGEENSLSYLMYSNMVQENINENISLKSKLNLAEKEINGLQRENFEFLKKIENEKINKRKLVTNDLEELNIKIDDLIAEKEKFELQRRNLELYKEIDNNFYFSFNKKVLLIIIASIFAGFFVGIVFIFLNEFRKSINTE
ncbi:MAG: Wzz/FepE/Etk N-terminal domain-containing protein [Candidatus Muiribacteriota bacterium]